MILPNLVSCTSLEQQYVSLEYDLSFAVSCLAETGFSGSPGSRAV